MAATRKVDVYSCSKLTTGHLLPNKLRCASFLGVCEIKYKDAHDFLLSF